MKCPRCGHANRAAARFCDDCGLRLDAVEPAASTAHEASPAPPGIDLPDSVVDGRYTIAGWLGEGGRKRVFQALDERSGAAVAVAVFNIEGMGEAVRTRARRESQAMAKLGRHPHIVSVLEAGEDRDGRPYIVSEYMPGGDLRDLLNAAPSRRLSLPRALEIAADICRGLEHAHGRGVVHRDLKPANIWFDANGGARIGDFGLATSGAGSRRADQGVLVGTVAYLPPEQALGRASDPRSDLYSLGAVIYEMLTGQPPFAGDDAVAIISRHLNAAPLSPSRHNERVPAPLDRLVERLLAKRPDERPAGAVDVSLELAEIAALDPDDEAVAAAEPANPLDALAGGIFVGRERELARMRAGVDEALEGRGGLLLLVGEPGIGKTRTAEELATYAQVHGARVHWGHCHEGEGAPAFWPWAEAIRSYARAADPVGLAWEVGAAKPWLTQVVPEIGEMLGSAPAPPSEGPEAARFRLFDAVSGFLLGAGRNRPLLIVLDDLHWADEPSLLLLRFLAASLGDSALLIVATYRDVELGRHHPLAKLLGELGAAERTRRVSLRGLDEEAIGRYIEMTTATTAPPGLAAAVHDRTEGNPFFVGEVVRLLAGDGRLGASADWMGSIPDGVREVIGRRLDRLSPRVNGILTVAAAVGREFELAVLDEICAESRAELVAIFAEAVEARMVESAAVSPRVHAAGPGSEEPKRWSFSHALIRETLYAELGATKRLAVHRQIAEALERLYGADPGPHLGELAHHFVAAAPGGDIARAVDYATRAARQAVAQLAHEEAVSHLRDALEVSALLGRRDRDGELELRLELAEAETRAGRFGAARATLQSAASLARAGGQPDQLARAALGLAALSETGSYDAEIGAICNEALTALGEADGSLRALVLAALATEEYWRDPQGVARPLAEQALAVARRVGDQRAEARALAARQFLLVTCAGAAAERLANAEDLIAVATKVGDRDALVRARAYRMSSLLERGETDAADRAFEEYRALAVELREPRHLWHIPAYRAMRAIMDGRFAQAERLSAEAGRLGARAEEPLAAQITAIQIAAIRSFQGRAEEMLPLIREMSIRYPAIPAWRLALMFGLIECDRLDEARVEYERIWAGGLDAIPLDAQWVLCISRLADATARFGDRARLVEIRQLLAPFVDDVMVIARSAVNYGPIARLVGVAARGLGEGSEAIALLERSIATAERMGDRPSLVASRFNLAEALLERGADADRERAAAILAEVIDVAEQIGMRRVLQEAALLRLKAKGIETLDVTTSIDGVILALGAERPDIASHVGPDGRVAILFSDIENSTLMTERLGDARWIEVLRAHNTIFRERISAHRGFEVKNQGDGFMLAFPDVPSALAAAAEIQADLAAAEGDRCERVRVRMGIHIGEAIEEEGDFFGRTVILAARIAAQAHGGEVLVSEQVEAGCGDNGGQRFEFEEERLLELKGLAGAHRVFRLRLDQDRALAAVGGESPA